MHVDTSQQAWLRGKSSRPAVLSFVIMRRIAGSQLLQCEPMSRSNGIAPELILAWCESSRKINMLAEEASHKWRWPIPPDLHTNNRWATLSSRGALHWFTMAVLRYDDTCLCSLRCRLTEGRLSLDVHKIEKTHRRRFLSFGPTSKSN